MRPRRGKQVRGMGCLPTNLEGPINKSKLTESTVSCALKFSNYSGALLTCLGIIKDEYHKIAAAEDNKMPLCS